MGSKVQALRALLEQWPANTGADEVIQALQTAWSELAVSYDPGATEPYKLARAEDVCWQPPVLNFVLERHGATVHGSSRAELHHWEVDLAAGTATVVKTGYRQLHRQSPKWDARPAAEEVANALRHGHDHPAVRPRKDGRQYRVLISEVVPAGNKQTMAGRSKRFNAELEAILGPEGWSRWSGSWWEPPSAD